MLEFNAPNPSPRSVCRQVQAAEPVLPKNNGSYCKACKKEMIFFDKIERTKSVWFCPNSGCSEYHKFKF